MALVSSSIRISSASFTSETSVPASKNQSSNAFSKEKMRNDGIFAPRNGTSHILGSTSGALTLFQFISLGLIIAIGCAANLLVVFAFSRYLQIRRSPYMLMFGFVCLDLARIVLCFPTVFISVVHRLRLIYGNEICQTMAFINLFCLLGNTLSIFGMAIDRYVDNKHRAIYRRKCRGSVGTAMLLMVWCIAFVFAFPTVYKMHSRHRQPSVQCLFPNHYHSSDVDTLGLLICATIAFFLTNLVYFRLFLFLRGRRRMRPVIYEPAVSENWGFYDPQVGITVRNRWLADSLTNAPIAVVSRNMYQSHPITTNYDIALWRSKKQKDNEKLTKLCFVLHVIFSLLWAPYIIICFCLATNNHNLNIPEWAEMTASWFTFIQVTITPFAYFTLTGLARRKFGALNDRFSPTLSNSST